MSLEYALYVLIVACAVLACGIAIYAARPLAQRRRPKTLQLHSRGPGNSPGARAVRASDHRARNAVDPAPWGWRAGSVTARNGDVNPGQVNPPSSPLQRWTDQWLVEKKTTGDTEYQAYREECIKALLEDRFCSQRRATLVAERRDPPKDDGNGHVPLGNLRTPWGW